MRLPAFFVLLFVATSPAFAQAATVVIVPGTATDANVATPIAAPVVYVAPMCGQAQLAEQAPPIVNPNTGIYQDPANSLRDCVINIGSQFNAIPFGSNYKAAVKIGSGLYGPLSTAFAMAAQTLPHPCDGAAPTSGTVVAGARTISWCNTGLDTNGNPSTITSWALYTNGTRSVLGGVTVGSTANAAGLKLYSAAVNVPAGTIQYEVAAVNAVGEAAKSTVFTAQAAPPASVPATSVIRGVN